MRSTTVKSLIYIQALSFSASRDITLAALLTSEWPETETLSKAKLYINKNRRRSQASLANNDNYYQIWSRLYEASERYKVISYHLQFNTLNKFEYKLLISELCNFSKNLRGADNSVFFFIDKILWEDFAVPHRELSRETRKLLRNTKLKIRIIERTLWWTTFVNLPQILWQYLKSKVVH